MPPAKLKNLYLGLNNGEHCLAAAGSLILELGPMVPVDDHRRLDLRTSLRFHLLQLIRERYVV
jgi:hypothetical protein